jgi:hypothetical protein
MQTDGKTQKLIVAFRNSANALVKTEPISMLFFRGTEKDRAISKHSVCCALHKSQVLPVCNTQTSWFSFHSNVYDRPPLFSP